MSDVVFSKGTEETGASSIADGFLGTGYTTAVELSFIAMAMIALYVAIGTFRYYYPDARIMASLAENLGLR